MTIAAFTIVGFYIVVCLAMFVLQDAVLFPGATRPRAKIYAPPGVEIGELQTADGTRYRVAIGTPKSTVRAVLLHFVGNGEDLGSGVFYAQRFAEHGFETLVTEYPGYGGSGGSPSYESILAAADASGAEGLRLARELGKPLLLSGQSLGSFSAVHLAARGIGERMLLVSPPTSIAEAGAVHYPFLPIRLLLRHPFDNMKNAGAVRVPTLVVHGREDRIVPSAMGERVAAAIPGAKLEIVPGRGHNDLDLASGSLGTTIREHFLK